jgi:hypothetical protein
MFWRKEAFMNNKSKLSRLVRSLASVAVVLPLLQPATAFAAFSCAVDSLCFVDTDPLFLNVYGNVWGNNPDWGQLPGGWNDRADVFHNKTSRHVCLYGHADYRRDWPGWRNIEPRGLPRGASLDRGDWKDVVSSNYFKDFC